MTEAPILENKIVGQMRVNYSSSYNGGKNNVSQIRKGAIHAYDMASVVVKLTITLNRAHSIPW